VSKLSKCIESGYGLLMPDEDDSALWNLAYVFDASGNDMALRFLEELGNVTDDLFVRVKGTAGAVADGVTTLAITDIDMEISPRASCGAPPSNLAPAVVVNRTEVDPLEPTFLKQTTIAPGVVLQWWLTTVEQRIRFRLVETEERFGVRWMALGFAEDRGDMHEADIILCQIDEGGQITIEDLYSPVQGQTPVLDAFGGGTTDILQWDANRCDFLRDFSTGDANDRDLDPDSSRQKLIFARGPGTFKYHNGESYKTTVILPPFTTISFSPTTLSCSPPSPPCPGQPVRARWADDDRDQDWVCLLCFCRGCRHHLLIIPDDCAPAA
jgi:hypothetical protein